MLCGVLFLDGLDISLVGVALPSIKRELGLADSQLQWVVSAYVLGYGGFLLLGGRTADLFGRKRTLLVALGIFAAASLLGGITSDSNLLLATRFLKGAAAAFTAPAGLSIITTVFAQGPERNRALSIYAATGASGFSLGLVVGGLATQVGWRLALIVPAPIAALLLVVGLRALPAETPRLHFADGFDLPGAVTLSAAMLLLVHTIVQAPSQGWGSVATTAAFAGSAALLMAFVAVERRASSPLVRLGMLRAAGVVRANVGIMAMFGTYVGFQFVVTFYLQGLNHWLPIKTALAFLPVGVLIAVSATRVGPYVDRIGTSRVIATGFLALTIGYALLLRIGGTPKVGHGPVTDDAPRRLGHRARVPVAQYPGDDRHRRPMNKVLPERCFRPRTRSARPSCSPLSPPWLPATVAQEPITALYSAPTETGSLSWPASRSAGC